ncbi:MAG: thioredoxin [Candidatus Omnitrophica bacterium]|nr:thioredoxin [Candidatus Omnitrophota bacterium]
MNVIHLSDDKFEQEVIQSKQLVLIDFWAPWCGPCQAIAMVLEQIAKEYNQKLKLCKINIDENQAAATKHQILSIPTLLFFKDGKVVGQLVGARPASDIKKTIDSLL